MIGPQGMNPEMEQLLREMMSDQQFMQMMQAQGQDPANFSEDELAAIYKDYKGERETLSGQKAYANELRTQPGPQGRSAGGIYAAASPLEHLGSLAQRGVGEVMAKNTREAEAALSKQEALGRQASARELSKAVRGGTPAVGAQPAPAGAPGALTPEQMEQMRRRRRGMMSA